MSVLNAEGRVFREALLLNSLCNCNLFICFLLLFVGSAMKVVCSVVIKSCHIFCPQFCYVDQFFLVIQMKNGACYLLFQGFQSPVLYHGKDLDLERLVKGSVSFIPFFLNPLFHYICTRVFKTWISKIDPEPHWVLLFFVRHFHTWRHFVSNWIGWAYIARWVSEHCVLMFLYRFFWKSDY